MWRWGGGGAGGRMAERTSTGAASASLPCCISPSPGRRAWRPVPGALLPRLPSCRLCPGAASAICTTPPLPPLLSRPRCRINLATAAASVASSAAASVRTASSARARYRPAQHGQGAASAPPRLICLWSSHHFFINLSSPSTVCITSHNRAISVAVSNVSPCAWHAAAAVTICQIGFKIRDLKFHGRP
jgi:hypothetical protein